MGQGKSLTLLRYLRIVVCDGAGCKYLRALAPISRRKKHRSNLIFSTALYTRSMACSIVSPKLVTPRTRPPAVTILSFFRPSVKDDRVAVFDRVKAFDLFARFILARISAGNVITTHTQLRLSQSILTFSRCPSGLDCKISARSFSSAAIWPAPPDRRNGH